MNNHEFKADTVRNSAERETHATRESHELNGFEVPKEGDKKKDKPEIILGIPQVVTVGGAKLLFCIGRQ